MDAPYEGYIKSLEHLQSFVDNPNPKASEEREVQEALLDILESLKIQEEALRLLQLGSQQAEEFQEVWAAYEVWPFIKLTNLDYMNARQAVSRLPHRESLLALLDECENLQKTNSAVQDVLENRILTAWRQKNPRFASMGTIDSDLQSKHLKDTEALARR